nr:immunoglobulin heavy chain junction region [Macaca mulatta]
CTREGGFNYFDYW